MTDAPSPDCGDASSVEQRVRAALDTIRPAIQGDGGDVEFVGIDADGLVRVRFQGACVGCMAANVTLTQGIERTLKQRVPEVTGVVLA